MHGSEDGLPLVLLVELAPRAAALGERSGVHESPQVEILLEVGQPVLQLVVIEVGLHKGDLDVGLGGRAGARKRARREELACESKWKLNKVTARHLELSQGA